jgi:hypothetical protein
MVGGWGLRAKKKNKIQLLTRKSSRFAGQGEEQAAGCSPSATDLQAQPDAGSLQSLSAARSLPYSSGV